MSLFPLYINIFIIMIDAIINTSIIHLKLLSIDDQVDIIYFIPRLVVKP